MIQQEREYESALPGKGAKTSDYYKVSNIPARFDNPGKYDLKRIFEIIYLVECIAHNVLLLNFEIYEMLLNFGFPFEDHKH